MGLKGRTTSASSFDIKMLARTGNSGLPISNNSSEDEPLIPHFLFEERKKICIKLPYCKKNEIASKKFISRLNSFTNFKYIFIILGQTRQIKILFSLKDKNLHKSHVIHEGECSCGENYVGETMRNFEVRITEYSNICHTSEPARHLLENPSHSFQWRVLCSARSYFKRRSSRAQLSNRGAQL